MDVAGITHVVLNVDDVADLVRIANPRSYPGTVEIEIRAGFDAGGELLGVLERSDWQRITTQRRGWARPSRPVAR